MLDIFTPVVPEDKQHPNFKVMLTPEFQHARAVVANWTKGFVDRDGKIIKEFQTTFNSSFWEFYLNACFNELGFYIDYTVDRPDFMLEKEGSRFSVEATIANHPEGGQPEWERPSLSEIGPDTWFQIIHLSTLRIASSISSKHTKYLKSYCKLPHVKSTPYIICIAPFDQPFFFEQADNAIRRVLYKFNAPLYIKDKVTGEIRIIGEEHVEKATKHTNIEIELGFFTDDRMKEVSAVIFSSTATTTKAKALDSTNHPETMFYATRYQARSWDEPYKIFALGGEYKESLLDGLHIYLNPFAETPFDPILFFSGEISLHAYDPENQCPMEFVNDGALLTHSCMSFFSRESVKDVKIDNSIKFKDYSFNWEEDKLYEVTASVGEGKNNHLAHYNGWTIAVFQDAIDNDWSAFAKGELVYTMQSFLSLGDEKGMLTPTDFYQTKDAAYKAIKRRVDSEIDKLDS